MLKPKALLILAIGAVFITGLFSPALADYREEFSKTLPLKAGESFSLNDVNGTVTVTTWKDNKVEIKAVKVAKDNEKDLKDVEIRVEESAGRVSVKAVWPKDRHDFHVSVTFDVKVPEGVNLDVIETVNGDVNVSGVFGSAAVESTNGAITAEGVKGVLKAETTNGEVKIRGAEDKVEAHTTNGSIFLEGVSFKSGLRAETTNGSIELSLRSADKLNAYLVAETTNGGVKVDFPVTVENLDSHGRSIRAKIGEGGPEIVLETTNGSITITK